ncbi:threonylcarbamoyladenosine tRNA methylthiotransferase MtaB [Dongia mobilis]|uniref:Threonylcarbamoyladenosine tRNA methylthiotransferase MtaB n=1 Tax=Dongia mobilis TaxID=578943 RepID=A0A4R6WTY8_9PROT|nr:tRNA (N(6)-L-threonylcarbamoyladenosine(37)-C(2))-methylthiotransferase MtaB [Dongia mobilis]TDQ83249.1 threonylcarbamoyladenosine tRNA methylthiotransferase MtaB [Dongia mobilis]
MADPQLVTFGCRLNAFESEVIRGHAGAAGLGEAIIINTCAVTSEAERQARQAIRRARRENPAARIIVTGCAAQIAPEKFAAMAEVDAVLGNEEKLKVESYAALARANDRHVAVADIMNVTETAPHLIAGFAERARAFVEIQQGCDHRCTFCIIPFGRGNSRSVPAGAIVEQIRGLVASGLKEVVLTGVDITSYGGDLPGRGGLGALVRRILTLVPELPRLRFSSLDVVEVDDELARLIAEEERLMPHLHLSLQAGDDMILKRMKRRHSRDDAIRFCAEMQARRPDIVFGADLIAGFPTESEAMFENSLRLVEECNLTFLHVFPYSSRAGTPAAKMPQVPGPVRKERAQRLRAAGLAAQNAYFARRVGQPACVLVERTEDAASFGHSEHFAPVALNFRAEPGSIVAARVQAATEQHLIAIAA